jgi:hypothetical protein
VNRRKSVRLASLAILVASAMWVGGAPSNAVPGAPPLAISSNVRHLGTVPTGPALGMVFKDHWAFVTGPTGLTVLDIAVPADPVLVTVHPLPHFENEDVDLCGNTLLITSDRVEEDLGSVLYAFDVSTPASPDLSPRRPSASPGTDAARATSRTSSARTARRCGWTAATSSRCST